MNRYSEELIVSILKEGEAGARVADLCRKYGMCAATYYSWKAKYSGLTTVDLKILKLLEKENRRIRTSGEKQALDISAFREALIRNN